MPRPTAQTLAKAMQRLCHGVCARRATEAGRYPCADDAGVAMTDSGPVSGADAGPARGTEGEDETGASGTTPRRRWPFWLPVGVLFVGLVLTGVLVSISASAYSSNEKRLLNLRVRDAGALTSRGRSRRSRPRWRRPPPLRMRRTATSRKFMKFIASVHDGQGPDVRVGDALAAGRQPDRAAGGGGDAVRAERYPLAGGDVLRRYRREPFAPGCDRPAFAAAAPPRVCVHVARPDGPLRRLRRERAPANRRSKFQSSRRRSRTSTTRCIWARRSVPRISWSRDLKKVPHDGSDRVDLDPVR